MNNTNEYSKFSFRAKLLVIVLSIWAFVACAAFFRIVVVDRENLVATSEALALYEGKLPPPRGNLVSKDGIILAWNERSFDLTASQQPEADTMQMLQDIFPENSIQLTPQSDGSFVLVRNLSPELLLQCGELIRNNHILEITPQVKRKVYPDARVAQYVGTLSVTPVECPVGQDGWEKEFNHQLAGEYGIFSVYIDNNGNWIEGSWALLQETRPGSNVTLPWTLEEICAGKIQ